MYVVITSEYFALSTKSASLSEYDLCLLRKLLSLKQTLKAGI